MYNVYYTDVFYFKSDASWSVCTFYYFSLSTFPSLSGTKVHYSFIMRILVEILGVENSVLSPWDSVNLWLIYIQCNILMIRLHKTGNLQTETDSPVYSVNTPVIPLSNLHIGQLKNELRLNSQTSSFSSFQIFELYSLF